MSIVREIDQDAINRLREAEREVGAAVERGAIVAWLPEAFVALDITPRQAKRIAAAIERGEHLKGGF